MAVIDLSIIRNRPEDCEMITILRILIIFIAIIASSSPLPAAPLPEQPVGVLQVAKTEGDAKKEEGVLKRQAGNLIEDGLLRGVLNTPEITGLHILKKQSDPRAWLKANLKTEVHPARRTISLRLNGGTRREQAVIVNAILDRYLRKEEERQLALEQELKSSVRDRQEFERHLFIMLSIKPAQRDPATERQIEIEREHVASEDRRIEALKQMQRDPPRLIFQSRAAGAP